MHKQVVTIFLPFVYQILGNENVYMYYMDVDGGIDVTLGYQKSCCGTGHAKELYYTFGATENQVIVFQNFRDIGQFSSSDYS